MVTRFFNEKEADDIRRAGRKGASLATLSQHDIPVPPGFIVLTAAYQSFIDDTGLDVEIASQWHALNVDDIHHVEEASETIRTLFREAIIPQTIQDDVLGSFRSLDALYVAVRSSSTAEDDPRHSWAGELETYLNITEDTLLEHIKKCWSSLFTPRAIVYRHDRELHGQTIDVGVVIQTMVEADVSGVCFTMHPVTNDKNTMLIEAVWGLGTALAEGMVTPDHYIYDRKDTMLLDTRRHEQETMIAGQKGGGVAAITVSAKQRVKQKMTEKEILHLVAVAQEIEALYGQPQNIEWALMDGELFILQTRPIGGLQHP